MNVIGAIKEIFDTQLIGNNGFRKREIVVETDEQYPQSLLIEFVQDKCDILDNYGIGQSVDVSINLKGREWVSPEGDTKYFNSIQGWRIKATNDSGTQSDVDDFQPPSDAFEPANDFNEEDHDDLPF